MAPAPSQIIGASGRQYKFHELLQERPHIGRVWSATSGREKFVLKDIPESIFSNFNENIQPRLQLHETPCLRQPCDTVPDQPILVYKYLTDDFLSLVRKGISVRARKQILKASLRGIAELHDRDIVHLDIKPDNIMVDCHANAEGEVLIDRVQVTDLENAAYLPPGRCIKGMLAGNDNWRSPEAHVRGDLNKPTDLFSFGVVAMLGRVIFGPDEDFKLHESNGIPPVFIRLQRQVSYFGDQAAIDGLLRHLSDDVAGCQLLRMLWEDREEDQIPYKPFSEWPDAGDAAFKDLLRGLTCLDPTRRITARQALQHRWLGDVE